MPREKKRGDNVASSRSSSRVEKKNKKTGEQHQQEFTRLMEKFSKTAGLNILSEPNKEMFNKIFNNKDKKKLN
jgi:hypothetical protein|tara:strand:+ start:43 stop:261 length:219 start_codon:yes stop_codon:yes gene_type:complete